MYRSCFPWQRPMWERPPGRELPLLILIPCLALTLSFTAHADIHFDETTTAAGITGGGTSFGASWGDFDGDGWPDVWVGDHDRPPALYLNQRDGSFRDIASKVWSENPRSDYHGAAWADFDGDGDQDLIVVADAAYENGKLVVIDGDDDLLENRDGRLVKVSKVRGITAHQSSRTPLWLDADNDGRLDLLIAARRDPGSRSVFYRQTAEGFRQQALGLNEERTRRRSYYLGLLGNLLDLQFAYPNDMFVTDHQESAQLGDLTGDGVADLVFFGQPFRVYAPGKPTFTDVTFDLGFPALADIADGAIADFDGDGSNDLFLTLGRYIRSDYYQPDPDSLSASIYGYTKSRPLSEVQGIEFSAEGPVSFELNPEWVDASQVRIGPAGQPPRSKSFTLDPDDEQVRGPIADSVLAGNVVAIAFDPQRRKWVIRNSLVWQFVDLVVRARSPITNVAPQNFEPFVPQGGQVLLTARDGRFDRSEHAIEQAGANNCMSVVAGDFDNDMDMDVYAVCTGAIRNSANLLFENDGKGHFRQIPQAGGAAGSALGRGDSVVTADYDRDGFLDLFVTNGADPSSPFVEDGPHQLFHNRGNGNHWVEIDLQGRTSNPPGIGSRVEVATGGVSQTREQTGGMHRFSQNSSRLHFGLGPHASIDSIVVHWPSGTVQRLENVAADRVLRIVEAPTS